MKDLFKSICTLLLISMLGCQQNNSAEQMLSNEDKRREVYTAILENEEMRNEMMGMMRERNMSGRSGMMADSSGMASMNHQQMQMQQLIALCETDSSACNMMSQMLMNHKGMMGNMMKNMVQRGMIDSTCMDQKRRK